MINRCSMDSPIRPSLILAIIKEESHGKIDFIGPKNTYGLMGVSKEVAQDYIKSMYAGATDALTMYDIYSIPYTNMLVGSWWLKQLMTIFTEEKEAIRAYDVGIDVAKRTTIEGDRYMKQVYKHEQEIVKQWK